MLLGTLASYILGVLWYGPLFGKKWMQLSGFTKDSMKDMPLTAPQAMGLGFVNTFVLSYFVYVFIVAFRFPDPNSALIIAFWAWLGFGVTTLASGPLWEGKSFKLFLFNAVQQLVSYSLMVWVIAWWIQPLLAA